MLGFYLFYALVPNVVCCCRLLCAYSYVKVQSFGGESNAHSACDMFSLYQCIF